MEREGFKGRTCGAGAQLLCPVRAVPPWRDRANHAVRMNRTGPIVRSRTLAAPTEAAPDMKLQRLQAAFRRKVSSVQLPSTYRIGAHDEDRTRLPGSTIRSLRQMGTWALVGPLVRSAGVEPAWSPTALSRRRVYLFRHEREKSNWRAWSDSNRRCFRDGLRIRSLGRWGHRSVVEDPGGFEPLAHGLKARSISIQV